MMPEPVTITIEPGPHNRLARIHEALRDLDLEICPRCHVWRGIAHFASTAGTGPWVNTVCTPCATGEPA